MKVRVFAPAFGDASCLDDEGLLELPEGARLADALKALKVPFLLSRLPLCLVNYARASAATPLSDGDVVSFFSIVSGG